ncbi:MAG: NFACT RNA binding domain-containing protein [Candidatus Woesearchaeota archaeon]
MKVQLDFNKTVDENASSYFEKAKKSRKKITGVKETINKFTKVNEVENAKEIKVKEKFTKLVNSKKLWFEKFKWFISSDGYLIIAGRDATTNEIIIKKHTTSKDIVFHTDMAGSPFAVIKHDSSDVKLIDENLKIPKFDKIPEQTLKETASFVALHAKAWKLGLTEVKVFYVTPEQVSKEANPGEFMAKGSFMIRGKTNYIHYDFQYAVGLINNQAICAPISAIQKYSKTFVELLQGNEKTSVVAKKIRQILKEKEQKDVSVDDLVKVLPAGGCEIKKERIRKY